MALAFARLFFCWNFYNHGVTLPCWVEIERPHLRVRHMRRSSTCSWRRTLSKVVDGTVSVLGSAHTLAIGYDRVP